jgi:hypothetical protein
MVSSEARESHGNSRSHSFALRALNNVGFKAFHGKFSMRQRYEPNT